MPPSIAAMTSRWAASDAATPGGILRTTLIVALHGAAFGLMFWSEVGVVPKVAFCFTWGLLNFFWLMLLRRPGIAGALSLAMVVALIQVSEFKYGVIWTTAKTG